METIIDASDNLLKVSGLKNEATGAYLNSATLTATLYDTGGTEIVGETWPISLSYVADSDGIYQGNLKDTLTLAPGDVVKIVIVADDGADLKRQFVEWANVAEQ
jgi:hypothetical protein